MPETVLGTGTGAQLFLMRAEHLNYRPHLLLAPVVRGFFVVLWLSFHRHSGRVPSTMTPSGKGVDLSIAEQVL